MKSTKAASRFAQALLDLALEKGVLEAVFTDMQLVSQTVAANKELDMMLSSPVIKAGTKGKVITAIFGSHISQLTMEFMALLTSKGREALIGQIASAFQTLYNDHNGIVPVYVTTVKPLSAAQREAVQKALSLDKKTIQLHESVDAALLGGMQVQIGDQRVDASLQRKLSDLKKTVLSNNISAI